MKGCGYGAKVYVMPIVMETMTFS